MEGRRGELLSYFRQGKLLVVPAECLCFPLCVCILLLGGNLLPVQQFSVIILSQTLASGENLRVLAARLVLIVL